jgi:anaphase-promoting complex subunit 2
MELAEAWAALGQSVANPHDESHACALVRGLQVIQKHDLSEHAVAWFLEQATEAAATDTVKRVWSCFDGFEKVESAKRRAVWANVRFLRALEIASSALDAQLEVAGGLESQLGPDHDVVSRCHANFTAVLFGSVSQASREAMYLFFENQFCEFEKSGWRPEGDVSMDDSVLSGLASDDEEDDDNEDMDLAEQDEWSIDSFKVMCSRIQHVGALPLAEEVFTEVLYSRIARVIQRVAEGTFDRALLSKIVTWAEHTVWPWLRLLLLVEDGEEDDDRVGLSEDCTESNEAPGLGAGSTFKQLRTRLQLFLYETLANLRISEMFDIIIDFPDSEPALDDLKAALSRTHQYPQLVTSLQQTFERRLLHPGANTSDIITQYISTIKALHRLDPSGTTLAAISRPVQAYLRGRPDTVRAIVTGLTDDSSSELFQELRKGGGEGRWRPRAQDWGEDVDDDGKGEGGADAAAAAAAWVPEPLQAGPNVDVYQKGSVDVIGMLVDVYGSTDLFLHEYRVLLSDKLLALTSYQIDREVHNVELLKVRFGEGSLHNCEVMLKDLSDSKRLDSYVHSESSKRALDGVAVDDWLNTKILSGAFWPQMPKEEVKMHSVIREQLESYGRYYSLLKKPRGLQWRPTLGVTKVRHAARPARTRFAGSVSRSTCSGHGVLR